MKVMTRRALGLGLGLLLMAACGDDGASGHGGGDAADGADAPDVEPAPPAPEGTRAYFDVHGSWDTPETFFDFPYPSDLRLNAGGGPDLSGVPNPNDTDILAGLLDGAQDRRAFPAVPVAWFRFDAALAPRAVEDLVPADVAAPLLLIDVDPDSPDRGALYPLAAYTLEPDAYTADNVLGVGVWPGVVLPAGRTYAFVVKRDLGDATGAPLGVPEPLWSLAHGERYEDAQRAEAVFALYQPLWETLETLDGVAPDDVAAATVFTTGDVVADLAALAAAVDDAHDAVIADVALDPVDGAELDGFCELHATLTLPEFQAGEPPYDREGLFVFDDAGALVAQRTVTVPLVLSVPKAPMPEAGYPLVIYVHGSGGLSNQVVDRGTISAAHPDGEVGKGPAWVLAHQGFAAAGHAMPVNPERVPGASEIAYLNFANLEAFRDTFRQGVLELVLLASALDALEIEQGTLAGCDGATLPPGATHFGFDVADVRVMGQSMGGMYTNMFAAVDPRVAAFVPTGAGGYWSEMLLTTGLIDAPPLLALLLGTEARLTRMHPVMHVLQTAFEPSEPIVYVPRQARRPLPGHPARDSYVPAGQGDVYFATEIYDAFALAAGNQQAGDSVWPTMQASLALAGADGLVAYPQADNRTSLIDGEAHTGVVVQYAGDGVADPHYVFQQLDAVKRQYLCFFATHRDTGVGAVLAPEGALTDACAP